MPVLRNILLGIILLGGRLLAQAPDENNGLVKWLSFKEAQQQNKTYNKPFLIDVYTDWCGWCKHMMKTTYSNPAIAAYINTHFYPVKFNAEGKDTIEYNGKIYKPLSPAPKTPHELAIKFLGERLSYPSTMFITNNFEYSLMSQGYLEEKKLEPILVFMVENAWRTSNFNDFGRHFEHAFNDTSFKKVPVKIHDIRELESLQKKKPKKVLVHIGANFCNSGKVMQNTTYCDTSLGKYINKNFHVVYLDAERTDTIVFKGQKYALSLINGYPMNALTAKISNNRISMPALCVLDEKLNTLEVFNFYQGPENLKLPLIYFGDNHYLKKTWQDFVKEQSEKKNTSGKK